MDGIMYSYLITKQYSDLYRTCIILLTPISSMRRITIICTYEMNYNNFFHLKLIACIKTYGKSINGII
jgi:hypothetical protein